MLLGTYDHVYLKYQPNYLTDIGSCHDFFATEQLNLFQKMSTTLIYYHVIAHIILHS